MITRKGLEKERPGHPVRGRPCYIVLCDPESEMMEAIDGRDSLDNNELKVRSKDRTPIPTIGGGDTGWSCQDEEQC